MYFDTFFFFFLLYSCSIKFRLDYYKNCFVRTDVTKEIDILYMLIIYNIIGSIPQIEFYNEFKILLRIYLIK